MDNFDNEKKENIFKQGNDRFVNALSKQWIMEVSKYNYSYNFTWMGRPIIQFPQDIIAMQELIWEVKPDIIIETGIARGGSLIYYASLLELIGKGKVIGIDNEIRERNKIEIKNHPMYKRIEMIEGDSISTDVVRQVYAKTNGSYKILVCLDSMHTYDHVMQELKLYSPLVTKDSYLVVFDTIIEDMPSSLCSNRPWNKNNNPKMAVREFVKQNDRFIIIPEIENKLLITVSPSGYLKCMR